MKRIFQSSLIEKLLITTRYRTEYKAIIMKMSYGVELTTFLKFSCWVRSIYYDTAPRVTSFRNFRKVVTPIPMQASFAA